MDPISSTLPKFLSLLVERLRLIVVVVAIQQSGEIVVSHCDPFFAYLGS